MLHMSPSHDSGCEGFDECERFLRGLLWRFRSRFYDMKSPGFVAYNPKVGGSIRVRCSVFTTSFVKKLLATALETHVLAPSFLASSVRHLVDSISITHLISCANSCPYAL